MHSKQDELKKIISSYGRLAVAFSGGVDSAYLLKTAHSVLGDDCLAVTAVSDFFPKWESEEAVRFCSDNHIRQIIVETDELKSEAFCANPKNRCYICKKDIFSRILEISVENGIETVAEASNMDDCSDYRPGMAAVAELGIESPLRRAGLYKSEIRALSRELGLPTWDKPSYACLASRFPYGEEITSEKLAMVEQAEDCLRALGFKQMRVRIHGNLARVEVDPEDIGRFMDSSLRERICDEIKKAGFAYVALDLQGYRSGSLNETLRPDEIRKGQSV